MRGTWGCRDAINAAGEALGSQIYLLYRMLHRSAGGSETFFALPEADSSAGVAEAAAALARADYARALQTAAYPGRCQGLFQILSGADGQMKALGHIAEAAPSPGRSGGKP